MATYCHRIYEVKTPEGKWIQVGMRTDCYHGFDSWCFPYSKRGFPKDSSIKNEDLVDDEGNMFAHSLSYVTADELAELVTKERANLKDFILKKIANHPNTVLNNKLDFIAKCTLVKDNYNEYVKDFAQAKDENEDELEYFDEEFEEYVSSYDQMNDELTALCAFCDNYSELYLKEHDEYYIPGNENERIVFYFD